MFGKLGLENFIGAVEIFLKSLFIYILNESKVFPYFYDEGLLLTHSVPLHRFTFRLLLKALCSINSNKISSSHIKNIVINIGTLLNSKVLFIVSFLFYYFYFSHILSCNSESIFCTIPLFLSNSFLKFLFFSYTSVS